MIVVLLMDDIPKSEVPIIWQIVHSFNSRACKSQGSSPTRTVASGGKGSSYPLPPGPVELDTSSCLWMDWFSLDSVILIIVTCNCLPFSYSRSIFRRHISWQVLKRAFRSLQIWKFSGGRIPLDPLTRFVPSALTIIPLRYKKSSYGPANIFNSSKGIYFLIRPLDLMALDFLHILLICSVKTRFYPWWHPNSWLLFSPLFRC